MDHAYVDDIVDGTLAAPDHRDHPFDTYNLATGTAPSVAEMIAILRETTSARLSWTLSNVRSIIRGPAMMQ
jgi:nucleoside-diphosphate-sugar epimerase